MYHGKDSYVVDQEILRFNIRKPEICLNNNSIQLSRQCGTLDISQPYRPPRPATGIAELFLYVLFVVYNVSFIGCVPLCAVFCLNVVCYFV
jgi:hypothetical protein